ncbi:MAG: 4Fe-4S binding protein, partial [Thermodesulfovibrionales bacterium]|nr:4Fe-4S binding protein [Thermodesulfovibrionales bacterium]
MISRRDFIKYSLQGIAAIAVPLTAIEIINPSKLFASKGAKKIRWGFLVDTGKCVGCGFCVKACQNENEIPYDINASRTWVERYVLTK